MATDLCPCGSSKAYSECCGPLHDGVSEALQAVQLMKARYSAFAKKRMDYVRKTQDPQTIQDFDFDLNTSWANSVEFLSLKVLSSEEEKNKGKAEFIATFKNLSDGEIKTHHELSRFRKQAGQWFFRDGKEVPAPATKA